jgi:adenylate cyclase
MATTTATRRLAAILAADVVGYSRLMGADEEGTHERLKAHLVELVDPKIREHHGRIVKTTGDGVLAEFAASSTRCAVPAKFSARWPAAISTSPKSAACAFASASISAT